MQDKGGRGRMSARRVLFDWYDASRPGYYGRVLVLDVGLVAVYAGTAAVVDSAILWVLLGMMLMRLAADFGRWQRERKEQG